jgi:hypothetical protein
MTLGVMTFSIMTLGIMTFSIMTFSITTLSIMLEGCFAECHLCYVSFVLRATNKPLC